MNQVCLDGKVDPSSSILRALFSTQKLFPSICDVNSIHSQRLQTQGIAVHEIHDTGELPAVQKLADLFAIAGKSTESEMKRRDSFRKVLQVFKWSQEI